MKVNASRWESAGRDNHRALEGWFTYIQRPTIAERTSRASLEAMLVLKCLYKAAFFSMKSVFSSGTSSRACIESDVQTGIQAPQSMQPSGSTYISVAASKPGSSCLGWMQSVGQTSTQRESLMQLSVI